LRLALRAKLVCATYCHNETQKFAMSQLVSLVLVLVVLVLLLLLLTLLLYWFMASALT